MKRSAALTIAIVCTLPAFIYAGPEPYSGKEMKQVAPMPPPCPSWTGFYLGGSAGYKYGIADVDLDLTGLWMEPGTVFADEARLLEPHSPDLSTSGFELGGLIGYNYQWHNWVFGAEAAGGYLWLRDSAFTRIDTGEVFLDLSTSFKTHYLFTFGGRMGYALCRWLPYVTGGLAVGDSELDQRLVVHGPDLHQGGSRSETNAGWFVGGGMEYAITNHWRARLQYQYIDLGGTGFDHQTTDSDFTGNSDVDLREHNASFAIIYGF